MGQLTGEQSEQLGQLLTRAYPTEEAFDMFVRISLDEIPDNFAPSSGIHYRFFQLILKYEAKAQIEELINAVLGDTDHDGNTLLKEGLNSFLEDLQENAFVPESIDPFDAYSLPAGRPFINRNSFRNYLRDLHSDNGRRFLLVNGEPGSGKTYSQYLVEVLAHHLGFKTCFIELKREIPSEYDPDVMVRRIDRDLTLPETDPFPMQQNVGDRWAQELCDWLVEKIRRLNDQRAWIALDGFSNPDLPNETKTFINFLISAVDRRLPLVRLILLDYERRSLPRDLQPFVHSEDIQDIDQVELKNFFRTSFDYQGIDYDDQQLQALATKILRGVPSDQSRMLEIMIRVVETTEQLLS